MSARDDYPTLVRMLDAFTTDDPDTFDIRIFGSGLPLAKALDEIDELRATIESGRRAYAYLLVRYDKQEAYLGNISRQLADCLVRKRT